MSRTLLIRFALVAGLAWGLASPAVAQDDASAGRVDINAATLDELISLPVPIEVARAIFAYREEIGWFESVYDLRHVEGVTPAHIAALRGIIATLPPDDRDDALRRYDESFNQVQRYLSQEGASEELAYEYLDRLRDPSNVNTMSLYDLQSYQNVSPVDAAAILRERERVGGIETSRQLRGVDGLSYWGYRNLRDFVLYEDPVSDPWALHGDLQLISYNTPYNAGDEEGADEVFDSAGQVSFVEASPATLAKLRLRLGRDWKAGAMVHRDVEEEEFDETRKFFLSYQSNSSRNLRLDRAVLGHYRVAFGQGLVMDNTDFYSPRRTGYGFNKRPHGVLGDVGRTDLFALNGAAAEATWGSLHGTGFFSTGKKDGILNGDGSINRYIRMSPRLTTEQLEAIAGLEDVTFTGSIERDAIEETVVGGNLKMELAPGTYVGVTGYEARYDKTINPDVVGLFSRPDLLEARDAELFTDYGSFLGFDDAGDSVQVDFRRVVGAEFQAVYRNVAVQGEYAKLDANPNGGIEGLFRNAPDAWIVNAYVQFGDFNLLALYRDYDVGFDNPYGRGFSNDTRYEKTLAEDPFRMSNPFLSWVAVNTPQPKPERGFFVTTRYRVNRSFTITGLDFDQWTRVADGQDQYRWTARMEYQPIFPLRFRLRQRYSSRSELGLEDVRKFKSWDTRLEARVRLSGFDELRLLYSSTSTRFAPRPRLSRNDEPGFDNNPYPQAGSGSQALQAQLVHNVNQNLQFTFTSLMYDGFLWNFEDNEFVLLDGEGFRNWAMVRTRLSDNLLLRFKFTHDRPRTRTNVQARDLDNSPVDLDTGEVYAIGDNLRKRDTAFRVQLDYTF